MNLIKKLLIVSVLTLGPGALAGPPNPPDIGSGCLQCIVWRGITYCFPAPCRWTVVGQHSTAQSKFEN